MKKLIAVLMYVFVLNMVVLCYAQADGFNIVLDPGHGGDTLGCKYEYDGKLIKEKDLNLKIALFMEKEFKNYKTIGGENINVYLTRGDEENPSIYDRVKLGVDKGASVVVSLHNNAHGDKSVKLRGAMVLVTNSQYRGFYKLEEDLSLNILSELAKLGIPIVPDPSSQWVLTWTNGKKPQFTLKNGLLRKLSGDGTTYENGDVADWYGIIRWGLINNIPAILLEHAYLDNEEDYRDFLSTDEKLQKIAQANVRGIATYYGLLAKF